MEQRKYLTLDDIEIEHENKATRIVAIRDIPELDLAGRRLPPTPPGGEVEVPYWAAEEITRKGYAKYREKEELTLQELSKTHWRETIPSPRHLTGLDERFYPKLRRLLTILKNEGGKSLESLKDYEKASSAARDIVGCRLKKIASLAASPYRSNEIKKNLTSEERVLFDRIAQTIDEWKKKVLEGEDGGEPPREP